MAKQVYQMLKQTIILQETPGYQMGDKLNEAVLARAYNCSVTPVREAVNMLRRDGLIVGDSYQSSSVIQFTEKSVADLFDLRECLELYALTKAFDHLHTDDLAQMTAAQKDYETAYEAFDEEGIIESNHVFHYVLIRRADNKLLQKKLEDLWDEIAMARAPIAQCRKSEGIYERLMIPVREHQALLSALDNRDLAAAQAALSQHFKRVKEDSCHYYATR